MKSLSEQKPQESSQVQAQSAKKRIICKFWMMGNCLKEDKCDYLHKEREAKSFVPAKRVSSAQTECSMYKLGFCKNGPMCNYKHVKETKSPQEIENLPELPVWFIESVMGKPLDLVFKNFEEINKEEVESLKAKYPKIPQISRLVSNYNYDIYAEKKFFILESLSKKIRYFFVRMKNMENVQFSMETNIILTDKTKGLKMREVIKNCEELIFIVFDSNEGNLSGFCKFKKLLDDQELEVISQHYFNSYSLNLLNTFKSSTDQPAYISVEWHWKTKLSGTKVELLRNPMQNNERFVNSKDFQEVSLELGYYICRMMIKRLTKEEVKQYMDYKQYCEEKEGYHVGKFMTSESKDSSSLGFNISMSELNQPSFRPNYQFSHVSNNTQTLNNNIIVTNISNVQVNFSRKKESRRQRSKSKSRSSKRYKDKKKDKKKKRKRSPSHSPYEIVDLRSDEENRTKEKHKNRSKKRKSVSEEQLVEDKAKSTTPVTQHSEREEFLQRKRLQEEDLVHDLNDENTSPDRLTDARLSGSGTLGGLEKTENKVVKNKLFSNAMEKIALNYLRKDIRGKN
jgi:hypothetical protein